MISAFQQFHLFLCVTSAVRVVYYSWSKYIIMSASQSKTESLSCRVSPEHKLLIEQAARVSGFTMSDYMVHTLVAAASSLIREESLIRLGRQEWDRLTASLERSAREPGPDSLKAAELYKKGKDEGERQVW